MPFKSLIKSSDYLPCRRVSSRDDRDAPMPFVFIAAKRRRVVTLARTNVGITTRGGFIIPANDLTKRTRRPGMNRVESRFPVLSSSRPIIVFLSPSLSLFYRRFFQGEKLFSHLYSPQCNLCWPRRAVRASIYPINHSKCPSTAAIEDTAIYHTSGIQLALSKNKINRCGKKSLQFILEKTKCAKN